MILRDGFNVRGLNTAATLWCSAAVGVLAAAGHLVFAAIATVTILAVHTLGRPLGRLIDHDVPGEEEDLRPYQLHVTCNATAETHIRALLVQHTTGDQVILCGLHTRRPEAPAGPAATDDAAAGTVQLSADLRAHGDAPARLEQLIARLSLEPGIHAVHWHTAEDPAAGLA